jgi:hypothetical protein
LAAAPPAPFARPPTGDPFGEPLALPDVLLLLSGGAEEQAASTTAAVIIPNHLGLMSNLLKKSFADAAGQNAPSNIRIGGGSLRYE